MTIASGVGKYIAVSKEATWGVKPAAGTAKYIRRVTFDLGLSREQFSSNEITSTAQTSSSRSGTDNVEGKLSGELSPGSYDDFFAALLRGPWTNGIAPSAQTTFSSSSVDNSISRSAGSFITDGFKDGDFISIAGFTAPATANNTRANILSVTAAKIVLDRTLVTKAAGDSVTLTVLGKKLVVPLSPLSRTNDSFTIEQGYTDVGAYRVATGCKAVSCSIGVQPDSIVSAEFSFMGKDEISSGTAYFTTPTAASTTGVLSGNSGAMFSDGVQLGFITDFKLEITGNAEAGKVVGNELPDGTRPAADIFLGRIGVTGEFSAYFLNDSFYNKFRNEDNVSLSFYFKGDGNEAMVIKLPRTKLGGAKPDDKETGGLMQSIPFTALLNDGTNLSKEQSTIVMQSILA